MDAGLSDKEASLNNTEFGSSAVCGWLVALLDGLPRWFGACAPPRLGPRFLRRPFEELFEVVTGCGGASTELIKFQDVSKAGVVCVLTMETTCGDGLEDVSQW